MREVPLARPTTPRAAAASGVSAVVEAGALCLRIRLPRRFFSSTMMSWRRGGRVAARGVGEGVARVWCGGIYRYTMLPRALIDEYLVRNEASHAAAKPTRRAPSSNVNCRVRCVLYCVVCSR